MLLGKDRPADQSNGTEAYLKVSGRMSMTTQSISKATLQRGGIPLLTATLKDSGGTLSRDVCKLQRIVKHFAPR